MEPTVMSVAMSVLHGVLGMAKTAISQEVALQLGVQRDLAFINDEFEMMQSFMMTADEDQTQKKVVKTWVKQVRDLGYDAEDCLQDAAVHLQNPSRWRLFHTLQAKRRIALEIKELKARVEDLSQRNFRYHLIEEFTKPATSNSDQPVYLCDKHQSSSKDATAVKNFQPAVAEGRHALNRTMQAALDESQLVRQEAAASRLTKIIVGGGEDFRVISVWGMAGIGKSTLVRSVCRSLRGLFQKSDWFTITHPFNPEEFFRSLAMTLHSGMEDGMHSRLQVMQINDLIKESSLLLEKKCYLIVLDDMASSAEWNSIIPYLPNEKGSRVIITTREESIARRCTVGYKLESLGHDAALDLFKKKVYTGTEKIAITDAMMEQMELILTKCAGLPLAISIIGGFLSTKPKNILEWRKLNNQISVQLDSDSELEMIREVLTSSYDGMPYHLKSCLLYSSVFPADRKIRPGRLLRRWIAEGYAREVRGKTAEEVAEEQLIDIVNRSMINLSNTRFRYSAKVRDSCQVHHFMREIYVSKSEDENLVFSLDENCIPRKGKIRHLVVSRSWRRGQKGNVLAKIMDVSHVRSLTVFGLWQPSFISKMRLLRVLDLEDAEGVRDRDLPPIGKLCHLKYLSLRGCLYVYHLPSSFRHLSELETLDIRMTHVIFLPTSIAKLRKLKYLRGGFIPHGEDKFSNRGSKIYPHLKAIFSAAYKSLVQRKSKDGMDTLKSVRHSSVIELHGLDMHGFKVSAGFGRLKALHTLGVVNIALGKVKLEELKSLTQLRKLGVTGVSKKNCEELSSVIVNNSHLKSLSIRAEGEPGLKGCLDELPPPPSDLQSLKLLGYLVKLPKWVEQLQTLAKLTLRSTCLDHDAIVILGKLPNLATLRLHLRSFKKINSFHFHPETFTALMVLHLEFLYGLKSVQFEENGLPKLEILWVHYCMYGEDDTELSGIEFLSSLKEVWLKGSEYMLKGTIQDNLLNQVAKNPNRPNLKTR